MRDTFARVVDYTQIEVFVCLEGLHNIADSKSYDVRLREVWASTRLCGAIVALVATDQDIAAAVAKLKTDLGSNWSLVTAFQFMSGSQAKFAAECCEGVEREKMLAAHLYALQLIEISISENLSLSAIIKALNQR